MSSAEGGPAPATIVVAERDGGLRLLRVPAADGSPTWRVEALDADGPAVDVADLVAALVELDTRFLAHLDDQPALAVCVRWSLAQRAGDQAALDRLMHPDLVMVDHRRLGLEDMTKSELLDMWSVGWSDDVALVERVLEPGRRAVMLQTIFVGGAALSPVVESRNRSVMVVEGGRISRIELFDVGDADQADACRRTHERSSGDEA